MIEGATRSEAETGSLEGGFFRDHTRRLTVLGILFFLLVGTVLISITIGRYQVPVVDAATSLFYHLHLIGGVDSRYDIIVWEIRTPRILAAGAVGAALTVAGCIFQGIFRNPLVEPYVLGVSSGAAFGAALAIVMGMTFISLQVTALGFAFLATFLTYRVATIARDTQLVNLLLSGLVIGSVFVAGLSYLKSVALPGQLQEITFWLMGGLYAISWSDSVFLVPSVIGLIVITVLVFGWRLNAMALGDDVATNLGVNVRSTKLALIIIGTTIAAISVALVGIIAWVGLLMPHLTRMLIGPDHRYLIPGSALLGAVFIIICDTVARTLTSGEIPITILTSIIGAPVLIYLLRRNKTYNFG